MTQGRYYITGGVKKGGQIRETLLRLAERYDGPVSVLYMGAASNNDPTYERPFVGGLSTQVKNGDMTCNILKLFDKPSIYEHASEDSIAAAFAKADIIFFDGGELCTLRDVFGRYGLKDLCKQAFERGASVGGLCAGGSILGSSAIHASEIAEGIVADSAIGLIPDTAITCYIGMPTHMRRLVLLEDHIYQSGEAGIGVPVDQTVTWTEDGGFETLFPDLPDPVFCRPD